MIETIILLISLFFSVLVFSYVFKIKECNLCNDVNVIRKKDIEMEKEKLNGVNFETEYNRYKILYKS